MLGSIATGGEAFIDDENSASAGESRVGWLGFATARDMGDTGGDDLLLRNVGGFAGLAGVNELDDEGGEYLYTLLLPVLNSLCQ
jgi:hypothetical protein